jgi:hypothetical protein
MRFTKTIAVAALLATAAAGSAFATPYTANTSLEGLGNARYATVLTVNPTEAKALEISVDTASLQQRIQNNPALTRSVQDQGFSVDQIIGLDNTDGAAITLYAL